mmetsp:Transcript_17700/g.44215  ORF Transcript_17700/g.44215 Transcript_17700/m.44215 type:complete len:227 (+) Transcript_17700:231-911(+)
MSCMGLSAVGSRMYGNMKLASATAARYAASTYHSCSSAPSCLYERTSSRPSEASTCLLIHGAASKVPTSSAVPTPVRRPTCAISSLHTEGVTSCHQPRNQPRAAPYRPPSKPPESMLSAGPYCSSTLRCESAATEAERSVSMSARQLSSSCCRRLRPSSASVSPRCTPVACQMVLRCVPVPAARCSLSSCASSSSPARTSSSRLTASRPSTRRASSWLASEFSFFG